MENPFPNNLNKVHHDNKQWVYTYILVPTIMDVGIVKKHKVLC